MFMGIVNLDLMETFPELDARPQKEGVAAMRGQLLQKMSVQQEGIKFIFRGAKGPREAITHDDKRKLKAYNCERLIDAILSRTETETEGMPVSDDVGLPFFALVTGVMGILYVCVIVAIYQYCEAKLRPLNLASQFL